MSKPALEIEHLAKRYGKFEALVGISLEVTEGSVFGLLGPNGAGKSTLVKSLLTIVRPGKCRGRMLGQRIGHRPTLARVGYLPEHARFPEYLSGRQIIRFSAGLAKLPPKTTAARIDQLLETVGMREWADRKNRTYSKGMRQRIGLAQALINEPDIVFLDEPTDGVDPSGRIEIRKMIERMRDEGRTVFVNSHLLGEVEQVADHVAIMANGKIIEQGSIDDLTRSESQYRVRTVGPVPLSMKDEFEANGWHVAGDGIQLHAEDATSVQPLIDHLRRADLVIREITEMRSSLEDVFLKAVERQEGGPQ